MSSDFLAAAAGILLSLIFSYVPGIAPWFAEKDATTKRGIMLLLIAIVGASGFAVTCLNVVIPGINVVCTQAGIIELLTSIITAAIANQTMYQLSPEPGWKKVLREKKELKRFEQMLITTEAQRLVRD